MQRIRIEFFVDEIPDTMEDDLQRLLKTSADYNRENIILDQDDHGQDDILRMEIYVSDLSDYANTRKAIMNSTAHIVGTLI